MKRLSILVVVITLMLSSCDFNSLFGTKQTESAAVTSTALITGFSFLKTNNSSLSMDVVGYISGNSILMNMSYADIQATTTFIPTVTYSTTGCSLSPSEAVLTDFSAGATYNMYGPTGNFLRAYKIIVSVDNSSITLASIKNPFYINATGQKISILDGTIIYRSGAQIFLRVPNASFVPMAGQPIGFDSITIPPGAIGSLARLQVGFPTPYTFSVIASDRKTQTQFTVNCGYACTTGFDSIDVSVCDYYAINTYDLILQSARDAFYAWWYTDIIQTSTRSSRFVTLSDLAQRDRFLSTSKFNETFTGSYFATAFTTIMGDGDTALTRPTSEPALVPILTGSTHTESQSWQQQIGKNQYFTGQFTQVFSQYKCFIGQEFYKPILVSITVSPEYNLVTVLPTGQAQSVTMSGQRATVTLKSLNSYAEYKGAYAYVVLRKVADQTILNKTLSFI